MNRQEAFEKIKNIETLSINDTTTNQKVDMVIKNHVLDIIFQIDEPQKVVVPKFVAEWIEWCKANDVTLLGGISPIDELGSTICSEKRVKSRNATRWAKQNQETFARAWLDGYELKEPLYTVEIPNPNLNVPTILQKHWDKTVMVVAKNSSWRGWSDSKLTEAEIKEDFEWAWQWAKEVE